MFKVNLTPHGYQSITEIIDMDRVIVLDIDLKDIISSTKYGKEGVGGIITKGTMYMGYPR